jgi:hypothetical protein
MTANGGGPRTSRGKQATRRNALKHGLSASLLRSDNRDRLEALCREYAQGSKDPNRVRLARQAAEARLLVEQVEAVRAKLHHAQVLAVERASSLTPAEALALAYNEPQARILANLQRYEQTAYAKWRKAVRKLEDDAYS